MVICLLTLSPFLLIKWSNKSESFRLIESTQASHSAQLGDVHFFDPQKMEELIFSPEVLIFP